MEQNFYIGALEIAYSTEQALPLQQFDSHFLRPVLPVTRRVSARLDWVDGLDTPPQETAEVRQENMLIWRNAGAELRLYLRLDKPPAILSRLSADHDRVTVTALKSEYAWIWPEFRPWFQIHLERLLLWNRALVLHSASILYRGQAILFSAPSGTGKTTQTDLWHEYRAGVSDLNGDRTVLQWTENGWYGCGFPIYGSMVRCEQAAAPLRAIVVVRQAKADAVRELSPAEKLTRLYSQCTVMRCFPEDVEDSMNLLEQLISSVTVIELDCTMKESAVDVLHRYLYGE